MEPLKINQVNDLVIDVRGKYDAATEFEFLLLSDVHWDNPKCVRKLFKKHMDQAQERGAYVMSFGDFFCMMQGRYDPRGSKKSVRPEHQTNNYLDAVINDAAGYLEPYADRLLVFGDGNHETNILKRLETDPIGRLVETLNTRGSNVVRAGYHGYVRFRFEHQAGGNTQRFVLYFHHGKWGGIVSKGTQSSSRWLGIVPDADLVVSGHTHDRWMMEMPRYRLKQNGSVDISPQIHLKSGTYKEEFLQPSGFGPEKIVAPKSLGGWWLRFRFDGVQNSLNMYLERAK